ncbi:hypothetical protein TIFTF001_020242 [Ficus carica]|uniref:Uncharacterized protein n=1 Tax=Ficus carica TaxID=3494 RepID=A0AA88DAV5_FICCA|nr:hypothetical protein TIFTF001_020242 [Ficus carica]
MEGVFNQQSRVDDQRNASSEESRSGSSPGEALLGNTRKSQRTTHLHLAQYNSG